MQNSYLNSHELMHTMKTIYNPAVAGFSLFFFFGADVSHKFGGFNDVSPAHVSAACLARETRPAASVTRLRYHPSQILRPHLSTAKKYSIMTRLLAHPRAQVCQAWKAASKAFKATAAKAAK